jgi:hypothetical protein
VARIWPLIDDPHPIGTRLAAAIIGDDLKGDALTCFQILSICGGARVARPF